jgi:glycosyltransferase involved in cell wall biosynthesis
MNNFLILVACRNAEHCIGDAINSVQNQSYSQWECLVLDDHSDDSTFYTLQKIAKSDSRISVYSNEKRMYAALSRWNLLHKISDRADSNIVIFLDGDDCLSHDQVLEKLDSKYQEYRNLLCTYGSILLKSGRRTWSKPYPSFIVRNNLFREFKWVGAHLFSFRKGLIDFLTEDMFYDHQNQPFKTGTDVALFMPILELVGTHSIFMEEGLYTYDDRDGVAFLDKELRKEQLWIENYIKNTKSKLEPLSQDQVKRIVGLN